MNYDLEQSNDAVRRALKGDQSAFTYLYEAYYKHAFIAANDTIKNHQECEDIVQETFERIFMKLQNGQEISSFGGYVKETAKHIAADHIKRREADKRPKEVLASITDAESDEPSNQQLYDAERSEIQKALLKLNNYYKTPEEKVEQKEIQQIVQSVLHELPDYQQESLSLFYLDGLKYREIAELYGVSENTIKSRVNQGKKKVVARIEELEREKKIDFRGLSAIAIFFVLLRKDTVAQAAELKPNGAKFVSTHVATKSSGSVASFFEKSIPIASRSVSTKVVTIITAGVIGIGGITGAVIYNHNNEPDVQEEVVVPESSAKVEESTNDTTDTTSESIEEPVEEPIEEPETETQEDTTVEDDTTNQGVYTSDTIEVDPSGIFRSESGSEISFSMYTEKDFYDVNEECGTITIDGVYSPLIKESTNIYKLGGTSKEVAIDDGGNTLRLYENGTLIETYTMCERSMGG